MDFDIVKSLYTYGPFALLVFFVYVIEGKVRSALKDASIPRSVTIGIYCATWMVIFSLCIGVVYIWLLFNVTSEATVHGTFENIHSSQTVSSRYNLFLHRAYNKGDSFDYDWRLITDRPLADGAKIDFDFSISPSAIPTRHVVKIRDSFYQSPVAIKYFDKTQKLLLQHNGNSEELPPDPDDVVRNEPAPFFRMVSNVLAAQSASAKTVYPRLDSPDPVIRRTARDEVAARGKAELPQLEKILLSEKNSARLRVAALSAINAMKSMDGDWLSGPAYLAIVRAASDPDPSLAAEAYRFFARFSVAGSIDLPGDLDGAASRSESLKVKAENPQNGDFTFLFTIARRKPGEVLLQLNEVQVFEDSSGGTTQWMFAVVAGQQEAFRLSNRRYGDTPQPKKYRMTAADKASAMIPTETGGRLKIQVIGFKPKNVPGSAGQAR